jgi:alpha-N-arabinofuranosidase
VEYCNGTKDTYWANLRRSNGHEEPYNVKYWALGNECYGEWQVAQSTKEDYAKKAYQWAKALKLLDPNINLILCGELGYVECTPSFSSSPSPPPVLSQLNAQSRSAPP